MSRTFRFLHQTAQLHLAGDETGGTLAVVEATSPSGPAAPLHVHRREDETFYVLDGRLTLLIGDQVHRAGPGALVHAPRHVPHTFTVDSPTARWLVISSPAGFEGFVARLGTPIDRPAHAGDAGAEQLAAAAPPSAPDPDQLAAVAATFGIEILGPPMSVEQLLAAAA